MGTFKHIPGKTKPEYRGSFQGSEIDLEYNWGKLEKMVNRFSEGGVEPDQLYFSMIDAIRSDRSDEAIKKGASFAKGLKRTVEWQFF